MCGLLLQLYRVWPTTTDGANFWGIRDLDNPNGGGNFYHTLTFNPIDVSTYSNVVISFDYEAYGFEIGSDYMRYEVFEDGVGQGQNFFLVAQLKVEQNQLMYLI